MQKHRFLKANLTFLLLSQLCFTSGYKPSVFTLLKVFVPPHEWSWCLIIIIIIFTEKIIFWSIFGPLQFVALASLQVSANFLIYIYISPSWKSTPHSHLFKSINVVYAGTSVSAMRLFQYFWMGLHRTMNAKVKTCLLWSLLTFTVLSSESESFYLTVRLRSVESASGTAWWLSSVTLIIVSSIKHRYADINITLDIYHHIT